MTIEMDLSSECSIPSPIETRLDDEPGSRPGTEPDDGEEILEASFTCQPSSTPNDMVIRFKDSYVLVYF